MKCGGSPGKNRTNRTPLRYNRMTEKTRGIRRRLSVMPDFRIFRQIFLRTPDRRTPSSRTAGIQSRREFRNEVLCLQSQRSVRQKRGRRSIQVAGRAKKAEHHGSPPFREAAARLKEPGHIIPTEKPHMPQPTRLRAGTGDKDIIR